MNVLEFAQIDYDSSRYRDLVNFRRRILHKAGSAIELAYRRGDELTKRRALMEAWEAHCEGHGTPAE